MAAGPPPPPPPLQKPAAASKGKGGGDRSALLSSINKGAKLKKTVTNDRSAPLVSASAPSAAAVKGPSGGATGPPSAGAPTAPSMPPMAGGLFAGGMPKLRSTGSKLMATPAAQEDAPRASQPPKIAPLRSTRPLQGAPPPPPLSPRPAIGKSMSPKKVPNERPPPALPSRRPPFATSAAAPAANPAATPAATLAQPPRMPPRSPTKQLSALNLGESARQRPPQLPPTFPRSSGRGDQSERGGHGGLSWNFPSHSTLPPPHPIKKDLSIVYPSGQAAKSPSGRSDGRASTSREDGREASNTAILKKQAELDKAIAAQDFERCILLKKQLAELKG